MTMLFDIFIILICIVFYFYLSNIENKSNSESVHVVIAHYNENLDWIKHLKYEHTVVSKKGIPKETAPNKGNEASSYLEYIINNYNNLSDITIFVHGHRVDWHHVEPIDKKINRLVFDMDYYNINDLPLRKIESMSLSYMIESKFMNRVLSTIKMKGFLCDIQYRCSAQFYVSKKSIQSNPIEVYKKLYNLLMETEESSYWSGRVFEYLWHFIFTNDATDV